MESPALRWVLSFIRGEQVAQVRLPVGEEVAGHAEVLGLLVGHGRDAGPVQVEDGGVGVRQEDGGVGGGR